LPNGVLSRKTPPAIELVDGVRWPTGAAQMQILDADGREVHRRLREETT